MRLEDKVAIITGAASGIGKATALLFAKEGAKVVVADIDKGKGEETVNEIKKSGGNALFIQADVTKAAEALRIANGAIAEYGRIDVLFNNVGFWEQGNVVETEEDTWDKVINANVKSTYLCSKYVLPKMVEQKSGVVINMGSVGGVIGTPNAAAYCAAKAAVVMLTRGMAVNYAPNVRVNCICPGPIVTKPDLLERTMPLIETARPELLEVYPSMEQRFSAFNRPGRPEEVANVALFLASDESSFLTGDIIMVDGGITCAKHSLSQAGFLKLKKVRGTNTR